MTDHISQPIEGFKAGKRQRVLSEDDDDKASGWNSTFSSEIGGEGSWNKSRTVSHQLQGGSSLEAFNTPLSNPFLVVDDDTSTVPGSPFDDVFENQDDDIEILSTASANSETLPLPSYDSTESMIAQKMSNLSMNEREKVYFDIHGVNSPIDEDAERGFRERKLKEMTDELSIIQSDDRKAYDMAHSANSSYVGDFNFRLRFLRAERFDAKLAAVRYARHYQLKLELFGPDKLGRNITQEDLESEDLEALYCGLSQILPRRDTAGRLVWIWIGSSKQQSFSNKALVGTATL
jgi:hypothetical protein